MRFGRDHFQVSREPVPRPFQSSFTNWCKVVRGTRANPNPCQALSDPCRHTSQGGLLFSKKGKPTSEHKTLFLYAVSQQRSCQRLNDRHCAYWSTGQLVMGMDISNTIMRMIHAKRKATLKPLTKEHNCRWWVTLAKSSDVLWQIGQTSRTHAEARKALQNEDCRSGTHRKILCGITENSSGPGKKTCW